MKTERGRNCSWPFLSVMLPIGRTCSLRIRLDLHEYVGRWQRECGTDPAQDESCLFNLCQDPRKRRSWTYCASGGYVLPTLRFSGSLLWSPKLKRWLLPVECVGALVWPVRASHAQATGVPLCNIDFGMCKLGNTIHVASVGTILVVALACTVRE